LGHICLRYTGALGAPKLFNRSKEDARAIIEKVYAQLSTDPSRWKELATAHSDDKRSARQGGFIGVFEWRHLPVYARQAAAELAKLEPGQISRIIESPVGFHIFRHQAAIPLGFLEIVIGYKGCSIQGFMARREITRSKAEALRLAKQVAQEARAPGKDFDAVAGKHTDMLDLEGYARGYRLFKGFTAIPTIGEAISNLALGDVSDPVETPYGFHVLKRITPEINARQIYIALKPPKKDAAARTEAEAKKLAEEVLAKLKSGEKTFEELARTYSDHTRSAPRGGDLGRVGLHYFYPPVERAAWRLKKGEITGVIRTQGGFTIVQRY
jgi:parvulin-like peptidyl-prolyl isomerase